jgi:hypothetical protein
MLVIRMTNGKHISERIKTWKPLFKEQLQQELFFAFCSVVTVLLAKATAALIFSSSSLEMLSCTSTDCPFFLPRLIVP